MILELYIATALSSATTEVLRAYEDAATAVGRLDATARLSSDGLRELLVLRCIAMPTGASHTGMIALVQADGEGDDALHRYGRALRDGAARARGGALSSVARLHESLQLPPASWHVEPIDDLLRDARERTPPVLKAALVAIGISEEIRSVNDESAAASEPQVVALAATLTLCVGGATTNAWLTLPPARRNASRSLGDTLISIAREARAAERGLAAAGELGDADEQRVRDSLGRAAYSALDVLALMRDKIVITVPETARTLGLTPPTAGAAVARLVELGIAREVTGKARSRAFAYEGIVRALEPEQ